MRNRRRRTRKSKSIQAEIEALQRQIDSSEEQELQGFDKLAEDEDLDEDDTENQNERANENWPVQAKTAARLLKLASDLLDSEL